MTKKGSKIKKKVKMNSLRKCGKNHVKTKGKKKNEQYLYGVRDGNFFKTSPVA